MSKSNSFIEDFKNDHSKVMNLMVCFWNAVESANPDEAKEALNKIEDLVEGHFSFEETYLYPRLCRLVSEITKNLCNEQQIMREFIGKSRNLLDKNRLSKNEFSTVFNVTPRLSELFKDCNDLVFLVEKFRKEDKEDLHKRFKDCCRTKGLTPVKRTHKIGGVK